eukprot:TRINITY_DN67958_c0_g1_i1.p1 TRINITY_DN67958_c0_g1~~TRINITY_DN67958_c0_g1_i1.p1  ORF type:complete len:496 (+),score=76.89 TRINITY_DN67958_c0_g1_i1:58-1545(+)
MPAVSRIRLVESAVIAWNFLAFTVNALQRRGEMQAETFRQLLDNCGDVEYTFSVNVGGTAMTAVLDSGSFEQYVLSTNCVDCQMTEHLYGSRGIGSNATRGIASFGSGTLWSSEATDVFSVGPLVNDEQSFWAVTRADMDIFKRDNFQVIFGIGPPEGALVFAEQDKAWADIKFQDLTSDGKFDFEQQGLLDRYNGNVKHAKAKTPFIQSMGVTSMSMCLLRNSSSPGFFIWNDNAFDLMKDRFVQVPAVGQTFWSAQMKLVALAAAGTSVATFGAPQFVDCEDRTCAAVLDTGTTFIGAPSHAVQKIKAIFGDWMRAGGTCDDVSSLPHLAFDLGGVRLALPAESYVGQVTGTWSSDMRAVMPELPNYTNLTTQPHFEPAITCQPLIMSVDIGGNDSSVWIFGIPFFRTYYTNFQMDGDRPKAMAFSVASHDCQPESSPATFDLIREPPLSEPRSAQMFIDASKARLPDTVRRLISSPQSLPKKLTYNREHDGE